MAQWFAMGGVVMWLVLLAGLSVAGLEGLAFTLALAGRFRGGVYVTGGRVLAGVSVLLAALPGGLGVAGWAYGRSQVDAVLAWVDPAQVEAIREAGYAEALVPLQFGGAVSAGLAFFALVACAIAFPPSRGAAKG